VTPHRRQQFKAKPGEKFRWSLLRPEQEAGVTAMAAWDPKPVQQGTATADHWGLVSVEKLRLAKDKRRLTAWG
jgi:hypothetical protein